MAAYGYRGGDYTTSGWISPQTSSYGAATTKPAGAYFSDSSGTKPTEYKYIYGNPSTPVHNHDSQRAGEYTKIQTDVSQHSCSPTYGPMNWRRPPYSSTGHNCSNGYSTECSNHHIKNDFWNRPSHNNDNYTTGNGDYYRRNDRSGRWLTTSGAALTEPTNNIGTAVENLKEAAAMSATSSRQGGFTAAPVSAGYGYGESVDSMDATRRYGNFKLTSRPAYSGEYYRNNI